MAGCFRLYFYQEECDMGYWFQAQQYLPILEVLEQVAWTCPSASEHRLII